MCDAELDFLKATVLSKSKEDVFMCSDMPMEEMSKIEDFPKKWMFGLAMILKKAKPLMQIFKSENKMDFNSFIENNINTIGNRTYILSVPPIFSLNEDSLTSI